MEPEVAMKVKSQVDELLEQVVVAPPSRYAAVSRYAAADSSVSRYAAVNRYAAASDSVSLYAAPAASITLSRYPSRYDRNAKIRPGRKLIRRTTLIIPPRRTQGQLLWLSASDYESCFDEWPDTIYRLGDVVEFDLAPESLHDMQCYPCDFEGDWAACNRSAEEDWRTSAVIAQNEAETLQPCICPGCEHGSPLWELVMKVALRLRAELAADPDQVVQQLGTADLRALADMVGLTWMPLHEQVRAAIVADPRTGLGAAALDRAVWKGEGFHDSPELAELLEEISQEEYVRLYPVENFLLRTGSLHPPASSKPGSPRVYPLRGDYVVAGIGYHSDPSGHVVCGWRQLYLEPVGNGK